VRRSPPAFLALSLIGLSTPVAAAGERPNFDLSLSPRQTAPAPDVRGQVAARDPSRGVPSLLWTARSAAPASFVSPEHAARWYLERNRHAYRAPRAAVIGARHLFTHDTGRGGVVVALRQTVGGIEVFHGDVKVLLDRSQRLVGISGSLHPAAQPASTRSFTVPRSAAVQVALRDLYGADVAATALVARGSRHGFERFELAAKTAVTFDHPARVKPVYFPLGERLVPAHLVEIQATKDGLAHDVFQYVVAADDGRMLYRHDATEFEAFTYRVWADDSKEHRPLDGPTIDFTPHPTGVPGEGPKTFTDPILVTMEGFNTNPDGVPDPWLPDWQTETRGNNVDAYADHSAPQGLSMGEYRADLTADLTFDRTYDPAKEPLVTQDQVKAAIVQLFYTTNWLHDWWYDSGFDEAAGNAQADNFGRGGKDNDPMLAEAQDGALAGSKNNANMSTPLDGSAPRMQMFLWTPLLRTGTLEVQPLNKMFTVGMASFGPNNYDKTAPLVVMVDNGGPSTTDGCTAAVNDVAGKIVLVDRGNCSFEIKSNNAQASGAVGVLIANNIDSMVVLTPGADNSQKDPTIPTLGLFKADGDALKAALQNGEQTAHMTGKTSVERDGTLDNMIVAHEWGHYIHHRLVECWIPQCRAQSEGWGDFFGLHMALRDGDPLAGVYPGTSYANTDPSGYFGIRRVPYSVDTTKNNLSFRHIADGEALPNNHPLSAFGPNSEVHNAGEIWTTMMWEAYVALQSAYEGEKTFDEVRRLFGDYVVAGMMMTPVEPTYTQQRDAILMAIGASNVDDMKIVAQAFAKRGAGTCAVSPPPASTDFKGVVEDFELQADASIAGVAIEDDLESCDHDGIVDLDEVGSITVDVFSGGVTPMPAGTKIEVIDPDPALVFPDGTSVELKDIAPLTTVSTKIAVGVDPSLADYKKLAITVRVTAPQGCTPFTERVIPAFINADVLPDSSTVDDVEVIKTFWELGGDDPEVWSRQPTPAGYHWHGTDVSHTSDTWLLSPPLSVSEKEPFVVGFDHAYSFEFSDNIYWDGGVIELTTDGGMTWQDVATLGVVPGYGGKIKSDANPINGRDAFVDKNAAWPAMEPASLDFGMQFAATEVQLRFRIGTDAAAGGPGWDIDNLSFSGIANTPFPSWTVHQGLCFEPGDTTGGDTSGGDTSGGETSGGETSLSGSSGEPGDTTGDDTSDPTGGVTTSGGSATTDSNSGTSGPASDSDPTTPGSGPGSGGSASASDSDGDTDSDSEGQTGVDDGCGCASSGDGSRGLVALGLVALGLRRRRRA
jgi:MYXO-CTERM domain-containing protein